MTLSNANSSIEVVSTSIKDVAPAEAKAIEKQSVSAKTEETTEESETTETESEETDNTDEASNSENADKSESKPKVKSQKGAEKKINKLTAEKYQLIRENEELKQRLASKPQTEHKEESKPQTSYIDKPNSDDFDSSEAYFEALADWKVDQRELARAEKINQDKERESYQKQVSTFQEKVAEFTKTTDDFDEVVADVDDIALSASLQDVLVSSDLGPQLMYDLAKNREELIRINGLPPLLMAKAIGKLEDRLSKDLENQKKPKQDAKQITKAPAPLNPVGSKGSASPKSLNDMDYDEYARVRREQMRNSRA